MSKVCVSFLLSYIWKTIFFQKSIDKKPKKAYHEYMNK